MNTRTLAAVVLSGLIVLFFGVNLFSSAALRSTRVDLTEDNLYTLPVGARNIARQIEEPIHVKLYYSRRFATGDPVTQSYARRVEDVLREFVAASNGTIKLEIIDPEPFSEQEDEAAAAGVVGAPISQTGEKFYFGLVATNSTDGKEVIPAFNPAEERLLNYELARRFYLLSHPNRPKVGIMSGLPIRGGGMNQLTGQPPQPAWQIVTQLQAQYDVSFPTADGTKIDDDVGVLLVVFPKNFSPQAWYAIDQFIMRGGRVIFAVDPHCVNYMPPEAMQNQMAMYTADRSCTLGPLGDAWGFGIASGLVAADQNYAVTAAAPDRSGRAVSYVAYLALKDKAIDKDDTVTASLNSINVLTGGVFEKTDDCPLTVTPLVRTSDEAMAVDVEKVKLPDPDSLIRDYQPGGQPITLVARLSGKLDTAFPDGPPEGSVAKPEDQVKATGEDAHIVLLTDCDMLSDMAWLRQMQIGGMTVGYQPLADNGSLVMNVVENLAGSTDLISIRASASAVRPFTRVQELQQAAEKEYLAAKQKAQDNLHQAEQKINQLLRGQSQSGDTNLVLTPDVQEELNKAREQQAESRKELREVQRKLNENVNRLGLELQLINIGLVPAAVALFAIGLGGYRYARRRRDRAETSQGAVS